MMRSHCESIIIYVIILLAECELLKSIIINCCGRASSDRNDKNERYIIYGIYLLSLLLIRKPLWAFDLKEQEPPSRHDCRKEPQKLQKEGTEEEGVSARLPCWGRPSDEETLALLKCLCWSPCCIAPTPSPRRNGTTSTFPPSSTSALPQSPLATELLARVSKAAAALVSHRSHFQDINSDS